jgi:hypothetical protein
LLLLLMSSKRGRKRNDNLPPNRARDVQRAFRARRAAHLQALESRVTELEEENNHLRAALNLPPANRPPLGKGPTGKDKPKNSESSAAGGNHPLLSSRESSSADSPSSIRTGSVSPSSMPSSSTATRSVPVIQSSNWDQSLIMNDQSPELPAASTSTYHLPPMSAPKPIQYNSYPNPAPMTTSRNSLSGGSMYMNYSHSADRPMSSASYTASTTYMVRGDNREDPRQYSYSQPTFSSPHEPSLSHPSPTSPIPHMHPQQQHHNHNPHQQQHPHQHQHQQPHNSHSQHSSHSQHPSHAIHREPTPANSYPGPRRSQTDPAHFQGNVEHFNHLATPLQSQHHIRLPSPPRLQDGSRLHETPAHMNGSQSTRIFDQQGRLHPMS